MITTPWQHRRSQLERRQRDAVRLERALKTFFKIEDADYARNPVHLALEDAKITKFEDEFLLITDAQLDTLEYDDPDTGDRTTLPIGLRNKLRCLKAFYHVACLSTDHPVEITTLNVAMFDQFRTSTYDPEATIKPWKNAVSTTGDKDAISRWQRTVKPSKSDYKEFRDETTWIRAKERFMTTLESQGLEHLVDATLRCSERTSGHCTEEMALQGIPRHYASPCGENDCDETLDRQEYS